LIVKVDTHVTLTSKAFNGHSGVVDTGLEAEELGLALVLLLTEFLHLFGVIIDGVHEFLKLHGVELEDVVIGLLGSFDGSLEALEFTVLLLADTLLVHAVHGGLERLHADFFEFIDGLLAIVSGLSKSLLHSLLHLVDGVFNLSGDSGLGSFGLSDCLDLFDEESDLVDEIFLEFFSDFTSVGLLCANNLALGVAHVFSTVLGGLAQSHLLVPEADDVLALVDLVTNVELFLHQVGVFVVESFILNVTFSEESHSLVVRLDDLL